MPFLKIRIGRLPISSIFPVFIMKHAAFAQADDVAARIGRDVLQNTLLAGLSGVTFGVGVQVVGG